MPDGLITVSYSCSALTIRKPFITRKEKQMIPAYGCPVTMKTVTGSINRIIPVMSRCLFQVCLLNPQCCHNSNSMYTNS